MSVRRVLFAMALLAGCQTVPANLQAANQQPSSEASGASSSPEPGNRPGTPTDQQSDPTSDRAPGDTTPADLRGALSDFRVGLTLDDALRVLDALEGQDRGIRLLIEGQRRGTGPNPEY